MTRATSYREKVPSAEHPRTLARRDVLENVVESSCPRRMSGGRENPSGQLGRCRWVGEPREVAVDHFLEKLNPFASGCGLVSRPAPSPVRLRIVEPVQWHGLKAEQQFNRSGNDRDRLAGTSYQRAVLANGAGRGERPELGATLQADALVLREHLGWCRKMVGRTRQGRAIECLPHCGRSRSARLLPPPRVNALRESCQNVVEHALDRTVPQVGVAWVDHGLFVALDPARTEAA